MPGKVASASERIETFIGGYEKIMPSNNFDMSFSRAVSVVSASTDAQNGTAKAVFQFTIPREYINNPETGGEIHGGAIATFFDNLTSATLLSSTRYFGQGVTRNMNVTYFRPPRVGEQVVIEAEVLQIGKRFATVQGFMKRESDGAVLAMCIHEKFNPEGPGPKIFSSL